MPSEALVRYQEFVSTSYLGQGMCWTVVWPAELDTIVQRLGGDPDDLETLYVEDAFDTTLPDVLLLVDQAGAAVSLVESNGHYGSRPETLKALSRDAEA